MEQPISYDVNDHLLSAAPGLAEGRRHRLRLACVLGPLFVLLTLWIYLFAAEGAFSGGPNGKTFGADFAMFMGAARLMQTGGNPYDHQALYRAEGAWMASEGLRMLARPEVVRVGNPPLLFWALRPLTRLPFQTVAYAWMVGLYILAALGFILLLVSLGWRHTLLPTLLFLLMPQVVLGVFYGNVVAVVFFGVCVALAMARPHPVLAGVALSLAWLKPPVGLPIVLLVVLYHGPRNLRLLRGFAVGSIGLLALNLLAAGPGMLALWVQGLAAYSRDVAASPAIASFAGLYVRLVPHGVRLGIGILSVAVGMTFTALVWHRQRQARGTVPWNAVGWLWPLWFLAMPYAHFFDEILLAAPIVALMGADGRYLARREPVIALYMTFASLLLISSAPFNVQLLWLPLVAVLLVLFLLRRDPRLGAYGRLQTLPIQLEGKIATTYRR